MWYNKNHNMIFFLTTGNFIQLANSMKTKTLKNMAERPMRFSKIFSIEFSFVSAFLWIRNCVRFDSSKWPEFIFKSYRRTRTKAEIKWSGLNWPRSSLSIISILQLQFYPGKTGSIVCTARMPLCWDKLFPCNCFSPLRRDEKVI